MQRTLKLDPRLLRFSVVKIGEKLEEMADLGGKAEWPGQRVGTEVGRLL